MELANAQARQMDRLIENAVTEDIEWITLYRCSECGETATTLGGLHAHIESHRPLRHVYRRGWDVEWLYDRTERYTVPLAESLKIDAIGTE